MSRFFKWIFSQPSDGLIMSEWLSREEYDYVISKDSRSVFSAYYQRALLRKNSHDQFQFVLKLLSVLGIIATITMIILIFHH